MFDMTEGKYMDIIIKDINIQFDGKPVLKDFSTVFKEGKINCIMGASGIGKTTLINILMELIRPDSGQVIGLDDKRISAVFQEDRLIEHWDAVKNILLVADKQITRSIVIDALNSSGLNNIDKKPVKSLSGGMRRRVSIIRALINDNDIIIMDEPFKGLDESLKKQIIRYIKANTNNKTVIVITHEKDEAAELGAIVTTMGNVGEAF